MSKAKALLKRVLLPVTASESRRRAAGMFSGRVNAVTGRLEWVVEERDVQSEDGDLSRELARSQYGDMLHDTARVGTPRGLTTLTLSRHLSTEPTVLPSSGEGSV